MKHIINYTPRHKEMIEFALDMAIAWHYANIEPVCGLMVKAYKRHNTDISNLEAISDQISQGVQTMRDIDYKGEAFGKFEVLRSISLPDCGEETITEEQAEALEQLCEFVMRLMVGQAQLCFDVYYIAYIDDLRERELQSIATFLHETCWNQYYRDFYHIQYSEESDILWDIFQVLRYARYLTFSEETKEKLRFSTMGGKPIHAAKEPLMKIRTVEYAE